MNNIKLRLMKKAPFLYKKTLSKLADTYNQKNYPWAPIEQQEQTDELTLEQVIGEICTEEFLDYLQQKFHCSITINQYTPKELLHNRAVLNRAINDNPYVIYDIPSEMITEEYIQKFEEYISKAKMFYSKFPVPSKFISHPCILDKYKEDIIARKDNFQIVDFLNFISKNANYFNNNITEIVDQIDFNQDRPLMQPGQYRFLNEQCRSNISLIKKILIKNPYLIDAVPEYLRQFALNYIEELIDKKEITFYSVDKTLDKKGEEIIFSSPGITIKYIKSQYARYCDSSDQKRYNRLDILAQSIQKVSLTFDFDSYEYTPEEAKNLVDIHNLVNSYQNGNYKIYSSKNILKALLKYLNLKDIALLNFNPNLFDPSLIDFFVDKLLEFTDYTITCIVNFYSKSSQFLLKFINKTLNDPKYKLLLEHNIIQIKNDAYDNQIINYMLDNVEQLGENTIFNAVKINSENKEFLKIFISKTKDLSTKLSNYEICLNKFSKEAFNEENLNILFRETDIKLFSSVIANNKKIDDYLTFENAPDIEQCFKKVEDSKSTLSKQEYLAYISLLIVKYKQCNIKSNYTEENMDKYISYLKEESLPFANQGEKSLAIDKILQSNRSPFSLLNVNDKKTLYYYLNVSDILTPRAAEYIETIPTEMLQNINKKHLSDIYKLIKQAGVDEEWDVILTFNVYLSIGYSRAKELLNPNIKKSYGPVNQEKLLELFKDINPSYVLLKKEGNSYVPELNEQWINIVFGANSKIKNTPIRNYLTIYEDKLAELQAQKAQKLQELDADTSLTPSEIIERTDEINKEYNERIEKYKSELREFIKNIGSTFNNWDIVTEEFLKAQNQSKLKIKLNLAKINELTKIISSRSKIPPLEARDMPLLETDIFSYVGYDTQFTENPDQAPARAVYLSRGMEGVFTKKFPNVEITDGDLTAAIYNPQDRDILTAGYKSGCCFRPNGNADNKGSDNSLLRYCTHTEYGGGIKIYDKNGKIIMFSPILRNGNVLMIHSIESKELDNINSAISAKVHKLLVEFAEKIVKESALAGDPIDFVTITNLHHLNSSYIKGSLPSEKKFSVYTSDNTYDNMYTNLNYNHMILASSPGATFDKIKYGEVSHSYEYPKKSFYSTFSFSNQELIIKLQKMDALKTKIVLLSNQKDKLEKEESRDSAYDLVPEIKQLKQEYMKEYKELLSQNNGRDYFTDYQKAISAIQTISKNVGIETPDNLEEISYGADWYVAITKDGKLIGAAFETGLEECNKYFTNLQNYNPNLEVIPINTYRTATQSYRI